MHMATLWLYLQRGSHTCSYTMAIPWLYHGYTMAIPWLYHGYTCSEASSSLSSRSCLANCSRHLVSASVRAWLGLGSGSAVRVRLGLGSRLGLGLELEPSGRATLVMM